MALGKEADIRVDNDLIQGIWMALIGSAAVFAIVAWLLADSTIQD
jgi:uncharacterized membrane protein YvlD (DUF360 family)